MKRIVLVLFCCPLVAAPLCAEASAEILIVAPGDVVELEAPDADTRVEAALGGGPLRPAERVTAPESGSHWLTLASRDASGNLSPLHWIRLQVDDAAPTLELELEPMPVRDATGRAWVPPATVARARASDALAGLATLAIEIGETREETADDALEVVLPATGEVAVTAWARDRVDLETAPVRQAVSIDSRPPSASVEVEGRHVVTDRGAVLAPDARLALHAHDDESGLASWEPIADEAPVDEASWRGAWSPGAHRAAAVLHDRVGHRTELAPFAFVVDDTPPSIDWQITSPGFEAVDGSILYQPPVVLSAAAHDDHAGVVALTWSRDGQTFAPLEGDLSAVGDRVWLRATDGVGNVGTIEARWPIDDRAPELALTLPDGTSAEQDGRVSLVLGEQLTVEARDAGSGLERARYRFGKGRWRPLPNRIEFLTTGRHVLTVEAADRLGQRAELRCTVNVARAAKGSV